MNEETFVKSLAGLLKQGPDVKVGPGDDCAVLDFGLEELVLAAADQVVSGVHFVKGTPPGAVARKLLNRNVSDIAAMGGRPTHALVTVAMEPLSEAWLKDFYEAMQELAAGLGVSIVGGDLSSSKAEGQFCSLSILGRVKRDSLCLRSGAREGDFLYATGLFGNSFASNHHLDFKPRLEEAAFLAGRFTRTMIDVSDGLLKDARRMADASGLAVRLDPSAIPLRDGASLEAALSDGEDYELLLAVKPALESELLGCWPFKNVGLTKVGCFAAGPPGEAFNMDGARLSSAQKGFDHFDG